MASICEEWNIPYLNLGDVRSPSEIPERLSELAPKVILCSIEAISDPAIQSHLQSLEVGYIAVDESQVSKVQHHTWYFSIASSLQMSALKSETRRIKYSHTF